MSTSEPGPNLRPRPDPELSTAGVSVLRLLGAAAVLLPLSMFLVGWALIVVTNNLDVAYALGVSDTLVTWFIVASSGMATGLVVARVAGLRGWKLLAPPVAALIVGVGIYLSFAAFETGEVVDAGNLDLITVGIGQVIAIVVATRIAIGLLLGVVVAILAFGIGSARYIQAIPEAPAEVLLVLDVYSVDEDTGECSGADELARVVEGSEVSLTEYHDVSGPPTEVGTVVLSEGFESGGECVFELGNPLGRPAAGYENIDVQPEADLGVPYSQSLQGNRVTVKLHRAED